MPKPSPVPSYRTRRRWTEKEARAALAALAASRLTKRAFAAHEGIDVQRLYSWRRKSSITGLIAVCAQHPTAQAGALVAGTLAVQPSRSSSRSSGCQHRELDIWNVESRGPIDSATGNVDARE